MTPSVVAVSAHPSHSFSKPNLESITLLAGLGVEGDVHCGELVKHRSRVAKDPTAPNLRQVHLMHSELFEELAGQGYIVKPGDLGENITTKDLNVLNLPEGTVLKIGPEAVVQVTGLRNPCSQIEAFQEGLLRKCLVRSEGRFTRKAGIMSVVVTGGIIQPNDPIEIILPEGEHKRLQVV